MASKDALQTDDQSFHVIDEILLRCMVYNGLVTEPKLLIKLRCHLLDQETVLIL